jgi:hypothetical protein
MTDHVVIDHHLDQAAGVYRLVTGIPIIETQPLLDENRATLLDDNDQPMTEQVTVGYDDVIDVVFDSHDDRWYKRSADDIAAEQRAIVQATIDERTTTAAAAPAASTAALPGVGDALNAASP